MADEPMIVLKENAVVDGVLVLTLDSIGANIKRKSKDGEHTVWATFKPQNHQEVLVGVPLIPGSIPPKNTVSMTEVHDVLNSIIFTLNWSLDDQENKPDTKENDW